MKLKSLLLGSAAALGLSTGAFAADVATPMSVVSLDACDAFGISGLSLSTDDTCLEISGRVRYNFEWGDYASDVPASPLIFFSADDEGNIDDDDGQLDWESRVRWELTFDATSETDMGMASAVVTLEGEDRTRFFDGASVAGGNGDDVFFSEAYVSVGDTTVLSAGMKDSIANFGNDEPYNYLGLFLSEAHDEGVYFSRDGDTFNDESGHVIQLQTEFGDGITAGIALENLDETGPVSGHLVGVVEVDQSWGSAHVTAIFDDLLNGFDNSDLYVHTGATLEFDPVAVTGAVAYDGFMDYWSGLLSAEASFDMFTIAASVEATNYDEFGFGASAGANVTDTIALNLGFRYFSEGTYPGQIDGSENWQVEGEVVAGIAENLEASVALGLFTGDQLIAAEDPVIYGGFGLEYTPSDSVTLTGGAEVNSAGAYSLTFGADKTF